MIYTTPRPFPFADPAMLLDVARADLLDADMENPGSADAQYQAGYLAGLLAMLDLLDVGGA